MLFARFDWFLNLGISSAIRLLAASGERKWCANPILRYLRSRNFSLVKLPSSAGTCVNLFDARFNSVKNNDKEKSLRGKRITNWPPKDTLGCQLKACLRMRFRCDFAYKTCPCLPRTGFKSRNVATKNRQVSTEKLQRVVSSNNMW